MESLVRLVVALYVAGHVLHVGGCVLVHAPPHEGNSVAVVRVQPELGRCQEVVARVVLYESFICFFVSSCVLNRVSSCVVLESHEPDSLRKRQASDRVKFSKDTRRSGGQML